MGRIKTGKSTIHFSMEEVVIKEFRDMARALGFTASKLGEMIMKAAVRSRTETIHTITQGLLNEMIDCDKGLTSSDKTILKDALNDESIKGTAEQKLFRGAVKAMKEKKKKNES